MNEMSERDPIISKRDSEFEESNIKRMRLDDDDDDEEEDDSADSLERTVSSSSLAHSASDSGGFFSVALSEEEEDDSQSSSFSSGCSSSETNELSTNTRLPFLDLEAQQISETETEISTLITNDFRKQGSSSSEILGEETAEMDSATTTTAEKRDREKQEKTEKSPTQAELDDFFSTAERYEQKRFTDKYNYDIVNDTPLEGRYEWVSLKP